LGSGMSIRYFPIFFLDTLKLSPVEVQILYIITSLGAMGVKYWGQRLSKSYGRCRVAVLFKWIGLVLMLLLILSTHHDLPTWIICCCYIVRTVFMNSTTPLTKSVLMDAVPKETRGKWSAIESVSMFSWSGSAFLGGLLVGWEGLLFNFTCTAAIQFCATMPLVMILLLTGDPIEEEQQQIQRSSSRRSRRSRRNHHRSV